MPIVTGRPRVGWVGEAGRKPATSGGMSLRTMRPQKAAAIVVVSSEVVRANPGGYITNLYEQLAEAFGQAFDLAALHGKASDGTATGPFDDYVAKTSKSVELGTTTKTEGGVHGDLVAALKLLTAQQRRLTGWTLDNSAEPTLIGATDTEGRSLYLSTVTDQSALLRQGVLLSRPVYLGDGVAHADTNVVGFGGDWRKAAWGVVGGISYDVSTQAAVTINGELVSLWENNLTAIRAEAEFGFALANADGSDFVKLTDAS